MYFSDHFNVSESLLESQNVFDISLVSDLPLFIDPFLIFDSPKHEYLELHDAIVKYLSFIRSKVTSDRLLPAESAELLHFKEIPNNWLGYSIGGNAGRGLGKSFAKSAASGLGGPVMDFGVETVTKGSQIERLFLFTSGTGKDALSDFVTNVCKEFLLNFTQKFAKANLNVSQCRDFNVRRVCFDYEAERWMNRKFFLPCFKQRFVLLTPLDLLTQSIPWINRPELFDKFGQILDAMPNQSLRANINLFISQRLAPPPGHPTNKPFKPSKKDVHSTYEDALTKFPEVANYYIAEKELNGEEAVIQSKQKVERATDLYRGRVKKFSSNILSQRGFFEIDVKNQNELLTVFADAVETAGRELFLTADGLLGDLKKDDFELICSLAWRADGDQRRNFPNFSLVVDTASTDRFETSLSKKISNGHFVVSNDCFASDGNGILGI